MLYFIQQQGGGRYIKIGCTNNIKTRITQLQTGSPERLKVLLVVNDAGREVEQEVHKLFASQHYGGEWYIPDDQLISYIDKCNERPDIVHYRQPSPREEMRSIMRELKKGVGV